MGFKMKTFMTHFPFLKQLPEFPYTVLYANFQARFRYPPKFICLYAAIWASTRENLFSKVSNSKGADQPAHPCSLISVFVIHLLESIISKLADDISIFWLVSVAEETDFSLALSETLKTGFVPLRPIYC